MRGRPLHRQGDLVLAAAAVVLTLGLLSYERVLAMLPSLAFGIGVTGVLFLGLPQAALSPGNAIVATVEENNIRSRTAG